MQFFLYEVAARVVAAYLCVDCYRKLRDGFAERKIASYSSDPINWILEFFTGPSLRVAHRDIAPGLYWTVMGLRMVNFTAGVIVAIFGWWHPTP